jgi:protein-tyrosine phosphatase/membrane-associated phospholipid phosphatase
MEDPIEPRPWRRALGWLLFLGPFFFASYGFATWVTGLRDDVGVVVYSWERHIPFVPWTIVPYWIIDLLYGISLLLCRTRRELDTHALRLLTAQVIAVSGFLLFPLRFSFERPPVEGVFGLLFDVLGTFDEPFNQLPSLHIALLVLLWVVYLRALPRGLHWPLHALFALIGVSVLTTWQHHFVDVPTGLWLGLFCLWLYPDDAASPIAGARLSDDPAPRVLAGIYALGALAVGAVALLVGGTALWLLWAAGSLALVAIAYLAAGPRVFQKRPDGTLSAAARWLLWPYLVGARLNSRAWTRGLTGADAVAPGLLLGRIPTKAELRRLNVAAVVDVSAELPCPTVGRRYASVPMLDLVAPTIDQLARAAQAVNALRATGPVLVCCALGFSRSALTVAAALLQAGQAASPEEALERVRAARPRVVVREPHRTALEAWWRGERARADAEAACSIASTPSAATPPSTPGA